MTMAPVTPPPSSKRTVVPQLNIKVRHQYAKRHGKRARSMISPTPEHKDDQPKKRMCTAPYESNLGSFDDISPFESHLLLHQDGSKYEAEQKYEAAQDVPVKTTKQRDNIDDDAFEGSTLVMDDDHDHNEVIYKTLRASTPEIKLVDSLQMSREPMKEAEVVVLEGGHTAPSNKHTDSDDSGASTSTEGTIFCGSPMVYDDVTEVPGIRNNSITSMVHYSDICEAATDIQLVDEEQTTDAEGYEVEAIVEHRRNRVGFFSLCFCSY